MPTKERCLMIVETFDPGPGTTFSIDIAPAATDGKRYPVVVLVHGNFGLSASFGAQLRDFTKQVADLGYLAALPTYYPDDQPHLTDTNIAGHLFAAILAWIERLRVSLQVT
jgi:carboxymethylenebutenolidase